jgi:sterol 24-C-methyltransferase
MTEIANTPVHARRDVRGDVERYRSFHENAGGKLAARRGRYEEMVTGYYDLVTDIYERGWGECFHFAPRYVREPFEASLKRHQHFIALRLGLRPGMTVLDIGCGVGGPMREIARFTRANIFGVNNNAYQVGKAREYNHAARLSELCQVLEADFMHIPRPDASVDAVYAFEATCHAPDKTALFEELFRVLKPRGRVAIYEWCLTDRFDPRVHVKRDIEEGNGLPDIWTIDGTRACFEKAGFRVLEVEDHAHYGDRERPWYHSLTGRELSNTGLRRSAVGKVVVKALTRTLEVARVAPRGTSEVSDFLNVGADALVRGGELGVFTPMAFLMAEKP